jgi:hypothetical protein
LVTLNNPIPEQYLSNKCIPQASAFLSSIASVRGFLIRV